MRCEVADAVPAPRLIALPRWPEPGEGESLALALRGEHRRRYEEVRRQRIEAERRQPAPAEEV